MKVIELSFDTKEHSQTVVDSVVGMVAGNEDILLVEQKYLGKVKSAWGLARKSGKKGIIILEKTKARKKSTIDLRVYVNKYKTNRTPSIKFQY